MKRVLLLVVLATVACTDTYDYDPASAGDQEGGARELRGKTSSQFLRGVYADLLGRTPQSYDFVLSVNGVEQLRFPIDEESMLTNALEGLGDSVPARAVIVNGMLHSSEAAVPDKATVADAGELVSEQFRKLLGRDPNPYELAAFTDAWQSDPAVGPRTVIRAIVGSREYQGQ
jgi:hypothetical protein